MTSRSEKILDLLQPGGALELAAQIQPKPEPQEPGSALFGRVLGDYELFAHIADGGMSRVYRARRVDGRFDRDVAVKVSVAGLLDERYRDRFFQEQNILASLNHPAIAQLYDAGIADEGWPYIVMELVQGVPINQYCNNVSLKEKIELVQKICAALRFAHGRLVVHRDIKPANVLVTQAGEPKLLDFGIAKLLTASSAATQSPSMTPLYASPEQLIGQPASVASDVYQVGLLLAEVLDAELLNRPTGLMEAMQAASTDAIDILHPQVRRKHPKELVAIIEQCLHAQPEDRYSEVNEIQEDLAQYLGGFPVRASGNSRAYKARKFISRNAAYLASAALVVAAFVLSGAWYLSEVNDARNRAEFEATVSKEVADFLAGLFSAASPSNLQGADLTAVELLDRGADRLNDELADRPRVHAQLQFALGKVYKDLGRYETSSELFDQAYNLQQQELGDTHPSTLGTLKQQANNMFLLGNLQEAERIYRELQEDYSKTLGPTHLETLSARSELAAVIWYQGHRATGEALQQEIVDQYRALNQLSTIEGIAALTRLAVASVQQGELERSIPRFKEALELSQQVLGPTHIRTIEATNNMGVVYVDNGQPEKSLEYTQETYRLALQVYGDEHHYSVSAAVSHSDTLRQLGRFDEAREAAEFAYEAAIRNVPRHHRAMNRALAEMGHVEMAFKNYERAETLFRSLHEIELERFSKGHEYTIKSMLSIASAMAAQERLDEAIELVKNGVALLQETQGSEHERTLKVETRLADLQIQAGDVQSAKALLMRVAPGLQQQLGPDAEAVKEAEALLKTVLQQPNS